MGRAEGVRPRVGSIEKENVRAELLEEPHPDTLFLFYHMNLWFVQANRTKTVKIRQEIPSEGGMPALSHAKTAWGVRAGRAMYWWASRIWSR